MSDSPTLTIRGQRSDDLEQLFSLLNTDSVVLNSFELPYGTEDAFRDRYTNPPAGTHTLVAETGLPSGRKRLIGVARLCTTSRRRRFHSAELSLIVHPDYQQTPDEAALLRAALDLADNWLGLRRIEVVIFTDQTARLVLLEQHDFEREATMRRYAVRGGVYADAYLMARLHVTPASHPGEVGENEEQA